MKIPLPRNLSGRRLAKLLSSLGYRISRQSGSHIRLEAWDDGRMHRVTVPDHRALKTGTLHGIVKEVAAALKTDVDALKRRLFG